MGCFSNKHTCLISHAAFFVGAPERKKNGTANHPSQNEGPQGKGFFLAADCLKSKGQREDPVPFKKTKFALGILTLSLEGGQEDQWIPAEPTWDSRQW